MTEQRSALVIGAGIGGLSAALALANRGWSVRIAEKAPEIAAVGAGLQISPNAVRVLDQIGAGSDIRQIATIPDRLIVRSATSGRAIGGMSLGAEAERRWKAPFLAVHRGDLQGALIAACARDERIRLDLDRRLERLAFRENTAIATLIGRDGTESVETGLLIGADGIWSKTRRTIGLPGPSIFSGTVAWRALVPAGAAPEMARLPNVNIWLGAGGHVVHYPLRGGYIINVVAIVNQNWRERGWSEPGDIDWIRDRFANCDTDLSALIKAAPSWLRWALFDRPAEPRWTRGRVALLGDAAHPMLPFMAQGASQAIEDAGTLADCLEKLPTVPAALADYEKKRLRHTARIQNQSRLQAKAYHVGQPFAAIRDLGMMLMGERGLAARYDWIYSREN